MRSAKWAVLVAILAGSFYSSQASAGMEDLFFPALAEHVNEVFTGTTWSFEGGENGLRNIIDIQYLTMTSIGVWGPVEPLRFRITEFTYPEMRFAGVFEVGGVRHEVRGAWRCSFYGGAIGARGARVTHYEVELLYEFHLDMLRMEHNYLLERVDDRRVLLRLRSDIDNEPSFPWHTRQALIFGEQNGGRTWRIPLTVADEQLMPMWTLGYHSMFPVAFRRTLLELLLIHSKRPDALLASLPREVLFMIFARLSEL